MGGSGVGPSTGIAKAPARCLECAARVEQSQAKLLSGLSSAILEQSGPSPDTTRPSWLHKGQLFSLHPEREQLVLS